MRIGELSRRTGVPTRMLRYYEEQALLHPDRAANGYRSYGEVAVYRVQQIRGLLDSGLTTDIIRNILPFLTEPDEIHLHPDCLTAEMAAQLRGEADRIQARIDCLGRNLAAIRAYLAAVQPEPSGNGRAPGTGQGTGDGDGVSRRGAAPAGSSSS